MGRPRSQKQESKYIVAAIGGLHICNGITMCENVRWEPTIEEQTQMTRHIIKFFSRNPRAKTFCGGDGWKVEAPVRRKYRVHWPETLQISVPDLHREFPGCLSRFSCFQLTAKTVAYDSARMAEKPGKVKSNQLFAEAVGEISREGNVVYLDAETANTTQHLQDIPEGLRRVFVNDSSTTISKALMLPQTKNTCMFYGALNTYLSGSNKKSIAACWFDYCGHINGNATRRCFPRVDIRMMFHRQLLQHGGICAFTFCMRPGVAGPSIVTQDTISTWICDTARNAGYTPHVRSHLAYKKNMYFVLMSV
jgi:hypothetical protein